MTAPGSPETFFQKFGTTASRKESFTFCLALNTIDPNNKFSGFILNTKERNNRCLYCLNTLR
jgi:hypothetical protein